MRNDQAVGAMGEFVRAVERADHETARRGRAVLGKPGEATTQSVPRGSIPADARRAMQRALANAAVFQRRLVLVPIAVAIAIFVLALVLVIKYSGQPKHVALVFGSTGLTLTLPLRWMHGILSDLRLFEMIIASMPYLADNALADLVTVALDKLGAPLAMAKQTFDQQKNKSSSAAG